MVVNLSNNSIPGIVQWYINSNLSSTSANLLTLLPADFVNDKIDLECSFYNPSGSLVTLSIKIIRDISLTFKDFYQWQSFDDNKIEEYRAFVSYGEPLGTPWQFLERTTSNGIYAESTKGKGFYAINDIEVDKAGIYISPKKLSPSPNLFHVSSLLSSIAPDIHQINGCHKSEPELLVYTESKKTIAIDFVILCETDDDIQRVPKGTRVANPTDVCIDGGVDLTIDGMLDPTFLRKDDDRIWDAATGRHYVVAGPNRRCILPRLFKPRFFIFKLD